MNVSADAGDALRTAQPGRRDDLYVARLVAGLAARGDETCIRHALGDVSAAGFLGDIHRHARALSGLGIGRGDVVALFAPNRPDALAIRYAANLIGAGATFLSAPRDPAARAELVRTIAPALLVAFAETRELVPDGLAAPLATIGWAQPGAIELDRLAANRSSAPLSCAARPGDLAVIVSSGGSTGVPKGSWRDFAGYSAMVAAPSPPGRRQLINGPLCYLSQVLVDITLLAGGVVVLHDRHEAADALRTIAAERITDLFLVEPQLFELMDHPDVATTDLSSLRAITHVGASAPATLRMRATRELGHVVAHTYGASEEGLVSVLGPTEHDLAKPDRFTSAGRLLPGVEVRIVGDDGTPVAPGSIGCIEVRSSGTARGYRNRPDLQAKAFRDGWYLSGDLGRLDAEGYLHILGRRVDVETIDGRLVSPTMIEDTLCRLPDVRYASVVVDRERSLWLAVVIPWPGKQVDPGACRNAVRTEHGDRVGEGLAVLERSSVPLTAQGKPDREAIKALWPHRGG